MARVGRAEVAFFLLCGALAACESVIGASFGSYGVADDGDDSRGGTASGGDGGDPSGGRGGDPNGGSAGSEVTGGSSTGGSSTGGSDSGTGGASPEGGSAPGGAGAGGEAGESGGPLRAASIETGREHSCATFEGGALKCWGYNFYGQLGQDHNSNRGDAFGELGDALPQIVVGGDRTVRSVVAGDAHTCALLDDGHVRCWGRNNNGQLGLGDTDDRGDDEGEMAALSDVNLGSGRTATAIDAGANHTCALLDDGSVKCWGENTQGCLGLGRTDAVVGDELSETVDKLPPVDLDGARVVAISAGISVTCARFDGGSVRCWGDNTSGQLGIGTGPSRGSSPNDMGANLPALALGAARVVEVGNQFACALLETGRVHCWGDNFNGQLGLGSSIEKTDTPTASVDVGNGRTVVELSVGNSHACVVLDTLLPKCWGYNGSGILGVGSGAASIGHTEAEMGDALRIVNLGDQGLVFALSAGMIHTCAILDAPRAVKCWGSNDKGQLGVGDKENRGAHSSEMGNALPAVDLGNAP